VSAQGWPIATRLPQSDSHALAAGLAYVDPSASFEKVQNFGPSSRVKHKGVGKDDRYDSQRQKAFISSRNIHGNRLNAIMANSEAPSVVHADPNETGVYEIQSLCMNCHDEVRLGLR
jgi:hypothetical protein